MRIRRLPPDSCISAQHTGLVRGSMVGTGALGVTIRHPTPLQPLLPQASKNYTTLGVTFPHGDRIPCQDCNLTQAKSQSLSRLSHKHAGKKICLYQFACSQAWPVHTLKKVKLKSFPSSLHPTILHGNTTLMNRVPHPSLSSSLSASYQGLAGS